MGAMASYVIGTGHNRSCEPSRQSRSSTHAIPSTSAPSRTTASTRSPSTPAALPAGATTAWGCPSQPTHRAWLGSAAQLHALLRPCRGHRVVERPGTVGVSLTGNARFWGRPGRHPGGVPRWGRVAPPFAVEIHRGAARIDWRGLALAPVLSSEIVSEDLIGPQSSRSGLAHHGVEEQYATRGRGPARDSC